MKVFVDTNVLVDIVCTREPFYENAKHIFTLAYEGHIDMVLSSLSYINAYYIGCRYKYWLSPKSRLKTFFLLQRNVYLCTHET